MRIAYVLNSYPMTSTTFIRREIEAHERSGQQIDRFAIRTWGQELVDPIDKEEVQRVYYLLDQGTIVLLAAFFRELITNPRGFLKALSAVVHMFHKARGRQRLKQIVYLAEATLLKQVTVGRQIDHVHTHFSSNSAAVVMLAHLMGGAPYSFTVHGPDELFEMDQNSIALKIEHAAFVSVISNYCFKTVNAHTSGKYGDKIHIVRCGLDLKAFDAPTPVPNSQDLICVGRLCHAKAQSILVEAFAKLATEFEEARLFLIGDGPDRPIIEQKILNLGLSERIILVGWKKNKEVCKAIANARALVMSSLAEGLPIVIMESLALGRPVVATDINGIPELIDSSCGWLAHPGDAESLAQNLRKLLSVNIETLNQMGNSGHERVVRLHDQEKSAHQLRELFKLHSGV